MDSDRMIDRRKLMQAAIAASTLPAIMTAGTARALNGSDAEGFVTDLVAELRGLVDNNRSGAEGAAEFLRLLEQRASVDAVGRFAMGRTWREMSDTQQANFKTAFRKYISNTYQNRFGEYAGEEIVVTGSVDAGSKGVLVKSLLKRPNSADVALEWLVSDRGGSTRLSDIIFEGVSLAISLRETFGGMLESRNGDIDGFIAELATSKGA
ncbi:MAG: ABC transporter substrate-binding protein [Pseudomonadota bacterium]